MRLDASWLSKFMFLGHVFSVCVLLRTGIVCFSLTLNMYKVTGQFPWSSLKETDRGVSAELNVRGCEATKSENSSFKWGNSWIKVVCLCSFLSGWPTTRWSGRVCGGSSAAWPAALPLLCARRADTRWNRPSLYVNYRSYFQQLPLVDVILRCLW